MKNVKSSMLNFSLAQPSILYLEPMTRADEQSPNEQNIERFSNKSC